MVSAEWEDRISSDPRMPVLVQVRVAPEPAHGPQNTFKTPNKTPWDKTLLTSGTSHRDGAVDAGVDGLQCTSTLVCTTRITARRAKQVVPESRERSPLVRGYRL